MTYSLLCALFLATAALAAALTWRRRPNGHVCAVVTTAVVLVILTAVFDNLMIAAGLFAYSDEQISGWRIGRAPLEDFAYPLAGLLLLTAGWNLLGPREEA